MFRNDQVERTRVQHVVRINGNRTYKKQLSEVGPSHKMPLQNCIQIGTYSE
jgi:hypothetical protein